VELNYLDDYWSDSYFCRFYRPWEITRGSRS